LAETALTQTAYNSVLPDCFQFPSGWKAWVWVKLYLSLRVDGTLPVGYC
jgi:hypothetical protein